jgi:hypothetical protein
MPKSPSSYSFPTGMSLKDTLPVRYLQDFYTLEPFSCLGIGLLTTLFLYRYLFPKDEKNAIRKLGGFPIFTAWTFFTRRFDFIWENFASDPSPHFKFKVLHVNSLPFLVIVPGRLLKIYAAQCYCFTWRGGSDSIL